MLRHFKPYHLALALTAALHALSFAPGPLPSWVLPFVQIFSLSVLVFYVLKANTVRQAGLNGFLFGLIYFTVGLYWLYISLHYYGGLSPLLAGLAVVLLSAFLALFTSVACMLTRWLSEGHFGEQRHYRWHLLAAALWASSWTLVEWLRGTLFTGFPWLNTGYAHIEGVLAPWAPITGVYGLTWLAGYASAAIAVLACAKDHKNDARAAAGVGLAVVSGLAGIALSHVTWSQPSGAPMFLRLVQGNVPQSQKFDPALIQSGIASYMQLAALPPKTAETAPKLIVLPETVVPLFQNQLAPSVWQQWLDIAKQQNATLLMGAPLLDASHNTYTNSAIAINSDTSLNELLSGKLTQRYDKHHLVPFGEFIPPGFRWFTDALNIPLGDFNSGPLRQRLLSTQDQILAPNICYEDVFGEEILHAVRSDPELGAGATLLINISNLGWFGDSWALRQHLQISRMRALETARPMLRATNTGITAAIDPNGHVRAQLPAMTKGVLDVEVQGMQGLTPYVRWGNWPILFLLFSVLIAGIVLRKRQN